MRNNNSITQFIHLPDLLSLANGVSGMISIIFSINNQLSFAALFIIIAGIFDFCDGKLARRLNIESEFGKQLDSLCDLCSFIIAPMIFVYNVGDIDLNLRIAAMISYIIAGLLRLARFNITGTLENGRYFEGLPVPFSIVLVSSYFAFKALDIPLVIWTFLFFIHAFLMISTVKIRKI